MKGAWLLASFAAFPFAVPAAAQQTVLGAIRESEASLTNCYREKAVTLDDGSEVAAILKATEAACVPQFGRFKAAWARLPHYPAPYAESQVADGVSRARKEGERAIERARAEKNSQRR